MMKIRTQLVVAFLLLSVLPLTGIVLYSYASSQRAVRRAVEAEAAEMTQEMNGRMSSLRAELGRSAQRVGEIPLGDFLDARDGLSRLPASVLRAMGESAPLVESLEVIPAARPASDAAATGPGGGPGSPPPPAPPAPPAPEAPPLVIDMQEILDGIREGAREGMTEEEQAEMEAAVGAALGIAAGVARHFLPRTEDGKVIVQHPEGLGSALVEVAAAGKELARKRVVVEQRREETRRLLGRDVQAPVKEGGRVVGWVRVQVRPEEVLHRVLGRTRRERGEVPFVVDAEGNLHAANQQDMQRIQALPLDLRTAGEGTAQHILDGWVVVTTKDPDSGLSFGVARPIRDSLEEVKRTAARNFGWGLALVGLALVGILPLSNRMTRDVGHLTRGAERIARGDLDTRVSVRSRNEIGALAAAFNRMAVDLRTHEEKLRDEERRRREQEIEQRLLRSEYERKTRELEEARSFQLSLLPKVLPDHPAYELAVCMQTAAEVGGDYYDFHLAEDGALTAAVGDATGHGARAGTMVTVVKGLFSADDGRTSPRRFLAEAAATVKRMDLGRMAMALTLARFEGRILTLAAAGMPPALLHRSGSGEVEEIALQGMPLGGLAFDYQEASFDLAPGDTLLLMSDGLPELLGTRDGGGEPFGYARVRVLFEELGGRAPEEILAGLRRAADAWTGGGAPSDDVTFVVVRARA